MSLLARALHLLGLTLAPTLLNPEPLPASTDAIKAVCGALVFAAILGASAYMRRALDGKLPKIAAVWCWVAVIVLIAAAAYYTGAEAPLARGVSVAVLPVWGALATSLAALAVRFLGDTWNNKALVAVLAVSAIGAAQLSRSASYLRDADQMWWMAIKMDGAHRVAVEALSSPLVRARKWTEATKVAERCLKVQPDGCACLELRADLAIKLHDADVAATVAQHAVDRCGDPSLARVLLSEALLSQGKATASESEARQALSSASTSAIKTRAKTAVASALAQQGKPSEALTLVREAIAEGAGRDTRILGAAMASIAGDFATARGWLEPVVKDDPRDVDAQFSLALVHERAGDRAAARDVYRTVVRVDPNHASARFSLIMLARDLGDNDEARQLARQFVKDFPSDSRKQRLTALLDTP